jgi:hypothetical protein
LHRKKIVAAGRAIDSNDTDQFPKWHSSMHKKSYLFASILVCEKETGAVWQ